MYKKGRRCRFELRESKDHLPQNKTVREEKRAAGEKGVKKASPDRRRGKRLKEVGGQSLCFVDHLREEFDGRGEGKEDQVVLRPKVDRGTGEERKGE